MASPLTRPSLRLTRTNFTPVEPPVSENTSSIPRTTGQKTYETTDTSNRPSGLTTSHAERRFQNNFRQSVIQNSFTAGNVVALQGAPTQIPGLIDQLELQLVRSAAPKPAPVPRGGPGGIFKGFVGLVAPFYRVTWVRLELHSLPKTLFALPEPIPKRSDAPGPKAKRTTTLGPISFCKTSTKKGDRSTDLRGRRQRDLRPNRQSDLEHPRIAR